MKRRSRRARTVGSNEALPSDYNTFSFDDNFVLVLTTPPRLQVQVLDEKMEEPRAFQVTIKKLVLTLAVLYKGLILLIKTKTGT